MTRKNFILAISKQAYQAVIFDLDGVVTKTAKVHVQAWKKLFDEYFEQLACRTGQKFEPFDSDHDYRSYVDGKPRYEGVKSFLASRNLELPYGSPDDHPDQETVCGLGNRKNEFFHDQLQKHGVEVYDSTVSLIHHLRAGNFQTAIVSSSQNCAAILKKAGLTDLFDARVDGTDSAQMGLKGKPDPDIFLEAARRLGVAPPQAVVIEDSLAGVQAGRRGGFGLVIGVDRTGHAAALKENGADLVVSDLAEIAVRTSSEGRVNGCPSALHHLGEIWPRLKSKRLAVFLDYDGTLTPIVDRPKLAVLSPRVRQTLKKLAKHCTVAIISGRDLKDVQNLVGLNSIFYAGSHGFDIAGPEGRHLEHHAGTEFLPVLDQAEQWLRESLEKIHGVLVERKKFSIAVHYRLVDPGRRQEVEAAVDRVLADFPELRKGQGKKIFELQPKIDWDKGKALLWLLEALEMDGADVLPLYIGDDVTDEDAFQVLQDRGLGIVVQEEAQPTAAQYRLRHPEEVEIFLNALLEIYEGEHQ
ncbi:MAG: trehalose-phosphatase [Deltaproteobacteria bacterium]|nr:trehalose-phosphatase [Deltaproteobacteria bacterium]